jgi:hypothetical protein
VRQNKRATRLEMKASRVVLSEEDMRQEMRKNGIILCNATCEMTGRYCTSRFTKANGLTQHLAKGKHTFLKGINARDKAVILAGRPGGTIAVGMRPDRMARSLSRKIVESPEGARGEEDARCFGKFNRNEARDAYYKPDPLVADMTRLFEIEKPKLDGQQMHDELKKLRDEDGGLKYAWGKRGTFFPRNPKAAWEAWEAWKGCKMCNYRKPCKCNGKLPTVAMCHSCISQMTQKKKKAKK